MASTTRQKIAVLIPCYNEEGGIHDVIKSFPLKKIHEQGYGLEIIVIDNGSTDNTAKIAKSLGATVLREPKKGKGHAMRRGFYAIPKDAEYIVMLDGDSTYRPEEILNLIKPLASDSYSVVIGSRLDGRILKGSMSNFNRFGNWMYSQLVRTFYRVDMTDVLTGYFAWKRDALERLRPHIKSEGFAIEMEMVTKMARLDEKIACVPISYHPRTGQTNLRPIYDGTRILFMFMRNLYWKPKTQTGAEKATKIKRAV